MAENDPKPAPKAAATPAPDPRQTRNVATDEAPNPDEVEYDERYVGIDPIYANSAYEEPLEPEPDTSVRDGKEGKEAKEATEAELDMIERVKENEEGCVVNVDEPQPFEEWVGGTDLQARKSSVQGVDDERVQADQQKLEEAKNEDGRIPPRSTSTHQPGVNTVT